MASVPLHDRARYRAEALGRLLDGLREGVFVGVLASPASDTWVTVAANHYLKRVLGYPPETPESEVSPLAAARFDDAAARAPLLEQLARDGAVSDYVLRMRRVDHGVAWITLSARAETDHDSGALCIEALMRDAGERRRLDDRKQVVDEYASQADKMAVLGQTISGVAHELNNPLATIVGWAERISEQDVDPTTRRGVDVILGEAERAARIVKSLLAFARKRPSTRALVDLNKTVLETLALRSYAQTEPRITMVTALRGELPAIFADAEQAILGAKERGSIVVRTWHDVARRAVVLEVNDDGPGLAAGIREKIFDPFFTTKAVGQGTGLGLTVAYAIAREHGGHIRVDSSPGRGASFAVEFPVAAPEIPDEAESLAPPL